VLELTGGGLFLPFRVVIGSIFFYFQIRVFPANHHQVAVGNAL